MAMTPATAERTTQVVLCGFGGQGVVTAGQILGRAVAVNEGRNAVMAQSYGPESRGGAAKTELILADGPIAYPRVTSPDVVVVLSQAAYEAVGRSRPAECMLIAEADLVELDPDDREVARRVPATRLAEQLGRKIVLNIVMLGYLCGMTDIVSPQALKDAVEASVPPGTEKLNLRAFDAGFEYATQGAGETPAAGARRG
jgi:2-oxoglutarate ferredoxin oxidoreductase subunit gamma